MSAPVKDDVKDKVADYLEAALGKPVDLGALPDDAPLGVLGLDSLTTIGVLVALLEDAGVDLGEYADSLVTPSTLGDLYALADRFAADPEPETTTEAQPQGGTGMTGDQRSQLDFYRDKLAYEIDSADLEDALAAGQDIVVVDGRSSESYAHEHIPGAISVPHRSISQESLSGLSKAPLYVAYCDGIGCNASTKTAVKLATAGFRVKELIGGLDWWKRDNHPTEGHAGRRVEPSGAACGCAG
ncbi:sulfurtransferase [Actinosynnema pretiosum subsp. pretiosum]|uniref:Rhodanese domain protein n=2 Tax=Actinosynnema TaxID=40566 RepID=C6WHE8_ACTMD|nr:rhodanese-like domain-containing protein [Actinosynnema mirum]ACU38067.1 Rhodanese domain protein [Actinosynnema mirum DSM 43827]QUF04409.1 sulfurtransferase [Actinosynnema pretiosum subsp. pretiosum]